MEEESQLLFFDTFTHENEEEYLDLVRFNFRVYITEIRVIPLGARIQAEFGGSNFRLGATNPSKFKLEFFVNDFNKKNACTFQPFGSLNYQQNVDIQFLVTKKIVTDCLVIRGKYNLLTLAIYGYKVPKKKTSPPPPQPTAPQQVKPIVTSAAPKGIPVDKYSLESYSYDYTKSYEPSGYEHHHQSGWMANPEHAMEEKATSLSTDEERRVVRRRESSERSRSYSGDKARPHRAEVTKPPPPPPPPKVSRPKTPPESDFHPCKEEVAPPEDMEVSVRPNSPHSPSSAKPTKHLHHDKEHVEGGGDMLGSDVEMVSEEEHLDADIMDDEDIAVEYNITMNIYQCGFGPLKFFHSPALTKFEIKKATNEQEDAGTIRKVLKDFSEAPHTDEWVMAIEALEDIPWNLSEEEFSELVSWVVEGLDRDAALNQPQVLFKVRHIKAGIHLASLLFFTEPSIIHKLLDAEVPFKLLDLLEDPHISIFMKLHIMRALDLILLTQDGVTYFTVKREKGYSGYQRLVRCLMKTTDSRSAVWLRAILKKIHLHEVLLKLKDSTHLLEENYKNQQPIDKSHLETISGALIAILDLLTMTKQHLAPPHQYLPAKHQFNILECSYDPLQIIYRMLRDNHLVENMASFFSCQPLNQDILKNAHNLLVHFQKSQSGLLFLLSNPESLDGLYQILLHNEALPGSLACHLQILQAVDWLLAHKQEMDEKGHDLDDPETVENLKILYGMVFLTSGKQALANVLAMENNLDALLPFLQFTTEEEHNQKLSKSVSLGYATDLLLLTVHLSENVAYLQQYKSIFIQFEPQDQPQVPKLQELSKWFLPFKDLNIFTPECIPSIMAHIKELEDQAENLPIEMIISVRILKALVAAKNSSQLENMEELKHKYALLQIFTHDGLSVFLRILENLHRTYLQPFQQSYALSSQQGTFLLSLIAPIMNLINLMLSYVIQCRGAEFQDLTPIFTLLHIHCLMTVVPSYITMVREVQTQILDTLLAYTQPSLGSTESDDALSQSLWTKMLREVLRFTVLSPSNFMTGLTVLLDLLPQTLPLYSIKPLIDEEVVETVNHRKLWSAHLLPLSSALYDMVQSLCATSTATMRHHLQRVCLQLCDLAMPTALIVLRAVLDAIEKNSPDLNDLDQVSTRILSFISFLIGHASFKMPFLALWRGTVKAEEKYVEVINKIVKLLGAHRERPYQEALVIILHALCDPDVGYVVSRTGPSDPQALASNLPGPDQLGLLLSSLLRFVGNIKASQANLPFALRILIMLSEHNYGYYCLKQSLDHHPDAMYNLLLTCKHINSKDNPESINIISIVLDLIRQLFPLDGSRLSSSQLRRILRWNPKDHPLLDLKRMMIVEDEELTRILDGLMSNQEGSPILKPKLPSPESCPRPVFIVQTELEDDPEAFLSFSDHIDHEIEPVEMDLLAMSEKNFPNFDFRQELESFFSHKGSNQGGLSDKHKSGALQLKRPLDTVNPGAVSEVVLKKPFIAPMRGNGMVTRGASRPNDPFRSRPPNTSRPPSTHVDDFLAFDGSSNTKRVLKDPQSRGRGGRGVGSFVQGTRGRNFSTPSTSTYLPRRETAPVRTSWMATRTYSKSLSSRGPQDPPPRGLLPTPRSREASPHLQNLGNRLSRSPWLQDHRFDSSAQGRRDLPTRHSRAFTR